MLRHLLFACLLVAAGRVAAQRASFEDQTGDAKALPLAPEGFEASLFAQEPLVRNPCAMAFDTRGRLFVGMGPQWRNPTPDSVKDQIVIIADADGDGVADSRHIFASGFNSVQSLAWRGRDLWVANSPDLTVVRDLDGDDVADEYVKVFTDLGNIEHGLHGLNWGPDGRLYLSKGNSKGISLDGDAPKQPGRVAPKAFRELWGYPGPKNAPALPPPQTFTSKTYQATFQDPRDDWGQTGGILRYDPESPALEIYARGFRNPWDMAFDAAFNWLGTDNDQTGGDRIFMPFRHAHFGWGHPWSPAWPGENHLPTAPNSGQVIEGSYTGIVFADTPHLPESHRGVWLIGDWMSKKIYLYRPAWRGALNVPQGGLYEDFITGTNALFRPTDLAMGPDGALWVLGWGRDYGGSFDARGEQINEGRVYRFTAKNRPLATRHRPAKPHAQWSYDELLADLASWVPAWQIDARDELLRRGKSSIAPLTAALNQPTGTAQETWAAWTLAKLAPASSLPAPANENQTLQCLRAGLLRPVDHLTSANPRLRLAAIESLPNDAALPVAALQDLLATETDPVVYHAAWRTLMQPSDDSALRRFASDPRAGVRRAGVLMRMEQLAINESEVMPLLQDKDEAVRSLAAHWLSKVKGIDPAKPKTLAVPDAFALAQNLQAQSRGSYTTGTVRVGETHYTDRRYALKTFPAFLSGASMIRTANDDEASTGDAFLRFDAPLDVTVHVAHDERIQTKPGWLTAFGDTDSVITSTDKTATFRLFAKDFPAGPITLGGNTADGKPGGKGHYFVILVPKPPAPTGRTVTLEEALAAMPQADPRRGEALFLAMGGAGCAACHQMNQHGHAFGPDLTAAGTRFDARHLLDSMLNPGAVITEGFSMMNVTMTTGGPQTGVLREQSALTLTLAQPGGAVVTLDRKRIASQAMLPVSMMPPFGALLTARQLADLTAFLLAQKTAPSTGFHIQPHDDHLDVTLDGQRIGTYQFRHSEALRPGWINVRTTRGDQVTRNYPPVEGRDATDHAHMHLGIALGFGHLDGHDYWRNTARIEHVAFETPPAFTRDSATFTELNRLLSTDGKTEVCRQRVRHDLQRHAHGWQLDITAEFFNPERNFYFGDQEEGGLGVRVATPLCVKDGTGTILNSHGDQNGTANWGKEAAWWDYSGTVNGKPCGILVKPHPANVRTCWGHTRDYGVMVLNPFPRQPQSRSEPFVKTVIPRGQSYRLGYSVIIHEGDAPAKEIAAQTRANTPASAVKP
jgi:putative membrane-bound dehydrogenase-like protein